MTSTATDAQLVADHLAGDRGAFATIYDRYGTTLYDTAAAMLRNRDDAADVTQDVFVVAAERMSQLRDASRLKPWLFAILRNEVYRRTDKRKRVVPTDFTEPVAEMELPEQESDEASDLEYQELAQAVRGAACGLDERDQLVLEYSVRQGLQGDELAAALGVSAQKSYGLVHRMRQRTERSLGAFCVARSGRKDCDELARILDGWDGEFSVLIRKRVARHIDGCDICERSRRTFVPFSLVGAAPAFAAPDDLRDRVLAAIGHGDEPSYGFEAPGGFPSAIKYTRRFGLWIALATLALLFVGGAAVYVLAADDDQLEVVDETSASESTTAPEAEATNEVATRGPSTTTPDDGTSASSPPSSAASGVDTTLPSTNPGVSTIDPSAAQTPTVVTLATTPATPGGAVPTSTTTTIGASQPPALPTDTVPATTATTAATTITTTTTTTTTVPPTTPITTVPPTTTVAPGALSLSAGFIDFGTDLAQVPVTLTNIGGQSLSWTAATGPAGFRAVSSPFAVQPTSGTLEPGASIVVTMSIDRTWPDEGPLDQSRVTFAAEDTSATIDLGGTIARDPVVRSTLPPASMCAFQPTGSPNPLAASAQVIEESDPVDVRFVATGPDGTTASTRLFLRAGVWRGSIATDLDRDGNPDDGLWTWTIEATDGFGNSGEVAGTTDVIPTFC